MVTDDDSFSKSTQGYKIVDTLEKGVERKGELAWLYIWTWASLAHLVLSLVLALSLVLCLHGRHVYPGDRTSLTDIFKTETARVHVSDVTTIISASLVAIRIASQAVMVSTVWRCAVILLQNDGLDLSQLNTMLTYRIPSTWSGKHAWSIVLVLVMMFPAAYNSPLVSGSVDWVTSVVYDNSTTVPGGFGSYNRTEAFWDEFRDPDLTSTRLEFLFNALGNAALSWSDDSSAAGADQYRFIARQAAAAGSIVEDVPVPYIEVHRISWDQDWGEWEVDKLLNQNQILYAISQSVSGHTYNAGNAVLFDRDIDFPQRQRVPATILSTKNVAVLIGGGTGTSDWNCENLTHWDDVSSVKKKTGIAGACWALGTVEFTAGIGYFHYATYLSNRTVEATSDIHNLEKVVGDPWSEYAIYMLSDMMSAYPGTRTSDMVKGNLTLYTETLIRQSYTSLRTTLFPYTPSQPNLKLSKPITFLEARVSRLRVFSWLFLNLLLPTSVILVSWLESLTSDHCKRNPIVDTALAPLLTDVREVLVRDTSGISNMTYVTDKDAKLTGRLQLKAVELPEGPVVFALRRAESG